MCCNSCGWSLCDDCGCCHNDECDSCGCSLTALRSREADGTKKILTTLNRVEDSVFVGEQELREAAAATLDPEHEWQLITIERRMREPHCDHIKHVRFVFNIREDNIQSKSADEIESMIDELVDKAEQLIKRQIVCHYCAAKITLN